MGDRPTIRRPVDEPREFPLELVNLLCDQGKFSEAEQLTERWIARKEWEYEQMVLPAHDANIRVLRDSVDRCDHTSNKMYLGILDGLLEQLEAASNDVSHLRIQLAQAEQDLIGMREAVLAIRDHQCNGCRQPKTRWGPTCSGMTTGDATHFHSPEWWVARALRSTASNPAKRPS